MERRFKLGIISINEIPAHGKNLENAIKENLPEGTVVLLKENNLETASLKVVLYNPEWEEVPYGCVLEAVLVKLPEPEKRKQIAYGH